MESLKGNKVLEAVKLAVKFVETLNEEELEKLLNKEVKITLEGRTRKKGNVKKEAVKEDFNEIANKINQIRNREEAVKYIDSLKLTKTKLASLGEKLGFKINISKKKDDIVNIIVEGTVGSKLKTEGLS